jgi:Cu+-exporting ATPase
LTHGKPVVTDIVPVEGQTVDSVLRLAASVEKHSEHPIAAAVAAHAAGKGMTLPDATEFRVVPGKGAVARVGDETIHIGNPAYLGEMNVDLSALRASVDHFESEGKTVMLVAANGRTIGVVAVSDTVKPDAEAAVRAIKALGKEVVMITGDNAAAARAIARKTGIDRVLASVLPDQKTEAVKQLQREYGIVAMVGDGINDAAALAQADVGIAIGAGTDIAIEAADIILVRGDLTGLVTAMRLSEATFGKIKQNLFWAFGYNLLAVPLAILGLLHPLIAEIAMAASSINVVTNSLRLRRFRI